MKKCLIIAEAGVNHNGIEELAYRLVDAAHEAGADIVKFQTFKASAGISKNADKARYQQAQTGNGSQFDLIKKLELGFDAHKRIYEYCQKVGIEYMSTAFDLDSLDLLTKELNQDRLKIASGEILNGPLLLEHAARAANLIVSTGMCTLGDIEQALGVIAYGMSGSALPPCAESFNAVYCSDEGQQLLKEKVTLLHCTTEYPAPFNEINLNVLASLKSSFELTVGYSDHTQGIVIPIAAVALGAKVIEKHFTLDRNMEGPDHSASIEPSELKQMVAQIRKVEMSLGSSVKKPSPSELTNRSIARKSLVAGAFIEEGDLLTSQNLVIKRPGTGISPMEFWNTLGTRATKRYNIDDLI